MTDSKNEDNKEIQVILIKRSNSFYWEVTDGVPIHRFERKEDAEKLAEHLQAHPEEIETERRQQGLP